MGYSWAAHETRDFGKRPFLLIIFILGGGMIAFSLILSDFISRPIKALKKMTDVISKGELDQVVTMNSHGEIQDLAEAVNAMAENLQKTMASKDMLVKEVTSRRKVEEELKRANADLARSERILKNMLYDIKASNEKLKNTQLQLLQSEKMATAGQLAAGIAHEIKNPLSTIILSIESLDKVICHFDDKSQTRFQMIMESAERANKIINELLLFSRQADHKMERIELRKVIEGAVLLARNIDRSRDIQVVQDFDGDGFAIDGDYILLEQAFLNLFSNAIDAMGSEGTLSIKAFRDRESAEDEGKRPVKVEVADTGCGVAEEDLKNIFVPFFTTKDVGKGTGLGLSTVYMIISERHKGDIKVESTRGQGTKFIITLPQGVEARKGTA